MAGYFFHLYFSNSEGKFEGKQFHCDMNWVIISYNFMKMIDCIWTKVYLNTMNNEYW